MTRRRLTALAVAAAAILAFLTPTDTPRRAHADELVPPAANLTARLDDQGNGYVWVAWIDNDGKVYNRGPILKLPPTTVMVLGGAAWWDVPALITDAARRWNLDSTQMHRVAWCESKYDPAAYNRKSGASGLFQFIPGTWARASAAVGMASASPFDPVANVEAAAWLMRTEGPRHWVCK